MISTFFVPTRSPSKLGNEYTDERTILCLYDKPQKTAHFIKHMLFYLRTIHLIAVQVESFTAHNL